jgi:hypothetical protein
MAAEATNNTSDEDWRLEAELDVPEVKRSLHNVVTRLRGSGVVKEVEASVPHDVVVTHDGKLLFAYAADEATLNEARHAIDEVLRRDGISARMRVSRWDDTYDRWHQTDPPQTAQEAQVDAVAAREDEEPQTRTMVASSGKLVRAEFEQTMLDWANKLGLECKIIEHPHLLTTQVAFTVTGPRRRIDEFSRGLAAEGWAAIRAETGVMLSPL